MKETIKKIGELIEKAEDLKNAYFWTPPQIAAQRRYYEEKNSIPKIEWKENGDDYSAEIEVKCSCNNIYVTKNFYRNGKKTTITAIKNSYKRLTA